MKTKTEYSRTAGQRQKYNIYEMGISEGKRERKEEIFVVVTTENFPKLMTEPNHKSRKLREHQAG